MQKIDQMEGSRTGDVNYASQKCALYGVVFGVRQGFQHKISVCQYCSTRDFVGNFFCTCDFHSLTLADISEDGSVRMRIENRIIILMIQDPSEVKD